MNKLVILAIIAITVAFLIYTLAVFWEKISKKLKPNYAIAFWIGFICNIFGMAVMTTIENQGNVVHISDSIEFFHIASGIMAIILMLIHCLWATWALYSENEKLKNKFHKFSIIVWLIWLIPYGIGMYIGITG